MVDAATSLNSHTARNSISWPFTGDAAMREDPFFLKREISHYEAMLKLHMSDESRAALMRLVADAEHKLDVATAMGEPQASDAAID